MATLIAWILTLIVFFLLYIIKARKRKGLTMPISQNRQISLVVQFAWHLRFAIAIALSAALFIAISSYNINTPGLQYDESLFVNAALGGRSSIFIYSRLMELPLMLMSYIGALKAYFYTPIFALFGVNVLAIRLPVIILSGISIMVGAKIVRGITGRNWLGVFAALLMATDVIFSGLTKADYGPVALMIFFKLCALASFYKLITTNKLRYAVLLVLCFALGLFDKLNFIWIALAFIASAVIVFPRNLLAFFHNNRKQSAFIAIIGIAELLFFGLYLSGPLFLNHSSNELNIFNRADKILTLYNITFSGSALQSMMLAKPISGIFGAMISASQRWPAYVLLGLAVLISILTVITLNSHKKNLSFPHPSNQNPLKWSFYLVLSFIFIGIQIIITREAGGPHHLMALWPFPHIIATMLIAWLMESQSKNSFVANLFLKTTSHVLVGALIVTIVWQTTLSLGYVHTFQTTRQFKPIWTTAIYSLAAELEASANTVDNIYTTDWGIGNQIFALAPKARPKLQDKWALFKELNKPDNNHALVTNSFTNKNVFIVTRASGVEVFPEAVKNALAFMKQSLPSATLYKTIMDDSGTPMFEIYFFAR